MQSRFWHERWQHDEIGFHRPDIHPALRAYWQKAAAGNTAPVLVPLCGKSLDLHWLAQWMDNRGHAVTGVELSGKAVREFFEEADSEPECQPAGELTRWRAGGVEIFEGDFFAWRAARPFELFYDRAALIALPPEMRPRYLEHLRAQLAVNASGLLVTLEYDQQQMDGPPFAVHESELKEARQFSFKRIARENVLAAHPGFAERGVTSLHECTWLVATGNG